MHNLNQFDFQLIEFSTTIHTGDSQDHEFLNVHHGFLSSRGVIPNEWNLENSRIHPSFSEIHYEHGIRLTGDKDILHVSQTQDLKIGEEPAPPKLAVKYLASITPGIFKMVRVEWEILVPQKDPTNWITQTFFRPQVISDKWDNVRTVPIIGFFLDDLEIIITFSTNHVLVDGEKNDDILNVSCRIEPRPFSNDGEIIGWLSEWAEHEELVMSHILPIMNSEDERE